LYIIFCDYDTGDWYESKYLFIIMMDGGCQDVIKTANYVILIHFWMVIGYNSWNKYENDCNISNIIINFVYD